MAALVYIVLFLALTGHSSATYCICKDGVGDAALQKALDYACGAGADCTPIIQNGACYNPNTVKDHCNWAVNSYFQKKGQTQMSCDFAGAATISQTPPSTTSSSCVYPASGSNSTTNSSTTTPSTTPSTTPTTGTTPTTTPTTGGTTTPTGTATPSTTPSVFGISPTGSSLTDSSPDMAPHFIAAAAAAALSFSVFLLLWG